MTSGMTSSTDPEFEYSLNPLSPGTIRSYSFWGKLKPVNGFSKYE